MKKKSQHSNEANVSENALELEILQNEIAKLQEEKSHLRRQLEERQELMHNLFTFVEANNSK